MATPPPIEELRPLLHYFPDERDSELVFRLPAREVAIGGNVELARRVLSLCDGRLSVAEIAAEIDRPPDVVAELIEPLVEQQVATDCAEAWSHFHRQSSVGSSLARPVSDAEASAAMHERLEVPHSDAFLGLRPRAAGALATIAARRRSARPGTGGREVAFEELSSILELMYGAPGGGPRPVPSGGGVYPLVVHVLLRRPLAPLAAGLWWYEPERAGVWLVRDDDLAEPEMFVAHPVSDALIAAAGPIVLISADLGRMGRKYGNRAYRLALMEAGAAMQNAYLAGAELDVPVRAIAGFVEARADSFLGLPRGAHSLLAIVLGS